MISSIERLDRELEFAPDMPGPLIDAIMAVRNELRLSDGDRSWFWRIVDEDGPPGLPSDEELALQLMLEAWKRTPA